MPNHALPLTQPPPVAANVNAVWWTSCAWCYTAPGGTHFCALPGRQTMLFNTPCGTCRNFTRRDP